MRNYNDEDLLQMVEMYAETQGYISSEDELSDRFDSYLKDILDNSSEEELSEMGEFCGNPCPYIDPRIEAIAEQHGCHWEWKHWSEIALVKNEQTSANIDDST